MRKKLFDTASFFVLGALLMSPLHSMEIEENKRISIKGNKASTIDNGSQKDHYLEQGLDLHAAPSAINVINEDPKASYDIEAATIEDFRSVRDTYRRLAINDPDYYLAAATSFDEDITSFEEEMARYHTSIREIRDLSLKRGDYKNTAYYNNLLTENKRRLKL